MKKIKYISTLFFTLIILSWAVGEAYAQQLPYYTQFKNNFFMLNPAIAGTKGIINTNMNYRMQWVGYDNAPQTSSISLHSRLFNGKMGAGVSLMQDKVGPLQHTNLGASYAYHVRFPDCELSAGIAGNYTQYTLIGSKILLHNSQDPSIDQTISSTAMVPDASAGIYLYNDRFHIGFSALHLMKSKAEFYKGDTVKKGFINYATQVYSSLGYNYSQNIDYIFENTLLINYVQGVPLMLDYTLRVHYKEKMFAGVSVRLRDAIALHIGAKIMDHLQVGYSYDILISKFRNYSSGSHEIMLIYNFNKVYDDNIKPRANKFAHQKYRNIF